MDYGADDGTWTHDLLFTKELLCHWATSASRVNLPLPRCFDRGSDRIVGELHRLYYRYPTSEFWAPISEPLERVTGILDCHGASEGNRTLVLTLGRLCSTIEPHSRMSGRGSVVKLAYGLYPPSAGLYYTRTTKILNSNIQILNNFKYLKLFWTRLPKFTKQF